MSADSTATTSVTTSASDKLRSYKKRSHKVMLESAAPSPPLHLRTMESGTRCVEKGTTSTPASASSTASAPTPPLVGGSVHSTPTIATAAAAASNTSCAPLHPPTVSEVTSPTAAPVLAIPSNVDATPPRKKRKLSVAQVNKLLRSLGISPEDMSTSVCFKAAVRNRVIELGSSPSCLNETLFSGKCVCGEKLTVTIAQAVKQPDYVGMKYEDGPDEKTTVICPKPECGNGYYVVNMCNGKMRFDCGGRLNHCHDCKNFGICLSDYWTQHCYDCGSHYYSGPMGFPCPRCGPEYDSSWMNGSG